MSSSQQNEKLSTDESIEKYLEARRNSSSNEDEHCLEYAGEINGVTYLNDSKSTRVTRTKYSLESIDAPVILILGGNDADNDYVILSQMVRDKVKAIVYLGANPDKVLCHYMEEYLFFIKVSSLREAVKISGLYSAKGEVVLFSPACPDDKEFDNYKSRGKEFKKLLTEVQNTSGHKPEQQ